MNNINALLFSTSVIGDSTKQGQLNIQSLINFQNLVNNLTEKENNIEISNIASQINTNIKIMKSVYEAVATLNLYGQLNEVVSLNTNELENNQIINYVLNNNNLTQEEKQFVLNSIKIISEHIIKNRPATAAYVNLENYKNTNQQLNLSTTKKNILFNNIPERSNSNNIVVNLAVVKNNKTQDQIADTNPNHNQNTQTIRVLPPTNSFAKIINSDFINTPVNKNSGDNIIVPTNFSQKIDIIDNQLKTSISNINIKLENLLKIKEQISELLNLFSDVAIDKKNEILQDEITNLKNYVKDMDNIINRMNVSNFMDSEQFKNFSNEISKIVNLIFISLINATAYLYNYQMYDNYNNKDEQSKDEVNPVGKFIKNNNYISFDVSQNNRNIYVAKNENSDLLKELISRIFQMLKGMNGELDICKKIEYVYKPTSSQSTQVTPDGVLLINTANFKNFQEFNNIKLQQATNNNSPVEINNNSNIFNIKSENVTIINNKTNNVGANKDIISNPVSITHTYDISKTFLISKDNINQSEINITNTNYNSDLKNIIDVVNTNFLNFIENKSEQRPVDVKIFEKIVDFADKVRNDIVIKQIVKNITDAVKLKISEKTEVKMMLRPENLGFVIVKFETKDNIINGRIDVTTTLTRDILKTNIVELKNALNNMGYNVENFEVSILNAYTSCNSNSNLNYFNKQEQQLPIYISNEIIEDIGVIAGTDSYLNYLA